MSHEIRALAPEDIDGLQALMACEGVRLGTLRLPWPSRADLARMVEGGGTTRSLVTVIEGRVVGVVSLMPRSGRQGHMADFFLAVHDDFGGRGLGRALVAAALDIADNWLGLRRIYLEVAAGNAPALALYEKFGFEREGLLRGDTITAGTLQDSIAMGRMRPAPERSEG